MPDAVEIPKLSSETGPKIVFLDAATMDAGDIDLAPLEALGPLVRFPSTRPDETVARIGDAPVVITNKVVIDRDVFDACPGIKLVVACATGVNNIDLNAARKRGVVVSNVAGYSTPTVVQHTLALLLTLATNLHRYDAERAEWPKSHLFTRLAHPVVELAGKTLGVVGLGTIGTGVADAAKALGMRVQRLARNGSMSGSARYPRVGREDFFRTSDVVTLHCPLTPETECLINADTLALMKPGAFLINTGRGGLIDEHALAEALRGRRIGGAGLDVLSTEPPPADHPLMAPDLPNLVVTPHTAWISREARLRLLNGLVLNIRSFLDGKPANRVA